ncbi:WD40/YVTN/BNR-like repeat-containing protein [candidate division KSB1 bacterium]
MNDIAISNGALLVVFMDQSKRLPKVLRSVDNGKSWDESYMQNIMGSPKALAVDPANQSVVYAACRNIYGNTGKDIIGYALKSTNSGKTWERIYETKSKDYVFDVFVDPNNSDNVFFGANHGIFISHDGGENWKKSFDSRCESLHITTKGEIYALTKKGIVRSDDNGSNWKVILNSPSNWFSMGNNSSIFRHLYVDEKNGKLYFASSSGLIKVDL